MANTRKNDRLPMALMVVGIAVLGSLGVYAALTRNSARDEKRAAVAQQVEPTKDTRVVQVPHSTITNNEPDITTTPTAVPVGKDPVLTAVNAFLRSTPVIPKGAEVKSVTIKDGLATVDFNKAFMRSYGTDDESTVVNGLLTALGQFKGVEKAVFTVEGQPIDTLGASDLSVPVAVLKPSATTSVPPR
jgi:hypothetical protein